MRLILLILTTVAALAASEQGTTRRDVKQLLSTRVPSYEVNATNVLEAAAHIAADFDVPMGVEWQGDRDTQSLIKREWQNVTVEQIIYDTAAQASGYRVDISNGVVHLRKAGFGENPRNPLNIRIPSFSVTNDYTGRAAFQLSDLVGSIIVPRQKPPSAACAGSYGAGASDVKVTMSMTGASVRDILDKLLISSHYAMWLVVFPDKQAETGFLKTNSLLRNTLRPEQPDWDFVPPYVDPSTGGYRADWQRFRPAVSSRADQ